MIISVTYKLKSKVMHTKKTTYYFLKLLVWSAEESKVTLLDLLQTSRLEFIGKLYAKQYKFHVFVFTFSTF